MCHLQAGTWPAMGATELQIHQPRRKMHGKRGIVAKLLEKCILCALRATPPAPLPLPGDAGGLSSNVDITSPMPLCGAQKYMQNCRKMDMCHLQAGTWPAMSATELQIHEPKRKMHGKHENHTKAMKKQHFAPSRPPRWSLARAIRGPHGALLGPHTAFQNPGDPLGASWRPGAPR